MKLGRRPRLKVPLDESIVAGTWRVYAFDGNTWALEPVGISDNQIKSKRTYHELLSDALVSLLGKQLGDGARTNIREFLSALKASEDRIRQSAFELSEYARLKGLMI